MKPLTLNRLLRLGWEQERHGDGMILHLGGYLGLWARIDGAGYVRIWVTHCGRPQVELEQPQTVRTVRRAMAVFGVRKTGAVNAT